MQLQRVSQGSRGYRAACPAGDRTAERFRFKLSADGSPRGELGAQTPFQLLTQFGDFHTRHDDKFAGKHFARLVVVGELTSDAAILAILIPAEAAIRNGFWADELEAAQ